MDSRRPPSSAWSRGKLVELLAPALGREQSAQLVARTAERLGFEGPLFDSQEARSIMEALSAAEGVVGASARFARSRLDHSTEVGRSSSSSMMVAVPRRPGRAKAAKTEQARTWRLEEVIDLLANSLGRERSEEIVAAELQRLGLGEPLDREGVVRLVDCIAQAPGLVGTVARFAKSRLVLSRS